MAGYADDQVRQALKHWRESRESLHVSEDLNKARMQLDRIRVIAADHITCECSAALMILEVLDRG